MSDSTVIRKPRSALPSHLSNGMNYESSESSPLTRTSVNARERDKLTASIRTSNTRRVPIDLRSVDQPLADERGDGSLDGSTEHLDNPTDLDVAHRDPRDESRRPTLATNRPASPYTLNPPIDFDGLSWPSEFRG